MRFVLSSGGHALALANGRRYQHRQWSQMREIRVSEQRLDDLFLEQLWHQWLLQIQRVIRSGVECDNAATTGRQTPEKKAANRAAWAMLDSLERVIGKTEANDAYGIGVKLAIWRHWRDSGERSDGDDPSLTLVRSAYRIAAQMSGIDFVAMIRDAEAEALGSKQASRGELRSITSPRSRLIEPGGDRVIQLF